MCYATNDSYVSFQNITFSTELRDEKNPWVWGCSAILITKTKVLTADHCLWMHKPADRWFDENGERNKKQDVSPTQVLALIEIDYFLIAF